MGGCHDRNEINKSCQGFCLAHNKFGVFVLVVPAFFPLFVMRKFALLRRQESDSEGNCSLDARNDEFAARTGGDVQE
jgi:hypothetical protein